MPPLIIKDVIKATPPAGQSIYIVMVKGSQMTEVLCESKQELKKFKKEFDAFNYIVDHRQDLLNSVPDDTKWNCFCRSRCTCHGM